MTRHSHNWESENLEKRALSVPSDEQICMQRATASIAGGAAQPLLSATDRGPLVSIERLAHRNLLPQSFENTLPAVGRRY